MKAERILRALQDVEPFVTRTIYKPGGNVDHYICRVCDKEWEPELLPRHAADCPFGAIDSWGVREMGREWAETVEVSHV